MRKVVMDKSRKMIGVWGFTADRLKGLSALTGYTQIELAEMAIKEFEERVRAEEEATREQ